LGEWVAGALPIVARELSLFAAVGLLIGGLDDLLLDLLWIGRSAWRRWIVYRRWTRCTARDLAAPEAPGRLAVFVPAWAEADVIGAMLRTALANLRHDDYRIFVGTYPNDPDTQAAVQAVADARVHLVDGLAPGPTTKAECLNRCWQALRRDERRTGVRYKAVLLHDAEDVVHPLELRVVDRLIERFDLVQLPVLPLIDPGSRWISSHYADEFAELHGRHVPLREALGAGIPAAGVGCALGRGVLARLSAENDGRPFDPTSLTEDYEIGLRLGALGARSAFVAMPAGPGEGLVAVRAFFPGTLSTAVRQKTRWITGIACAGWDRLRWDGGPIERWMRLRDRRAVLAAAVVAIAYAGMALCLLCRLLDQPIHWPAGARWLLAGTSGLLGWRLAMRGLTVARFYGWREGLRSLPRLVVANLILILAASRAIRRYRPGITPPWDKTSHHFPATQP
jgi:adsorption protein B